MRISDWSSDVCSSDLHRGARREAGDQPVAAARIALVLAVIARNADQHRRAIAAEFDGAAAGPDVLVVIFGAGGEIVAEAAARQPRDRTADAAQVPDRRAVDDDKVSPIIGAVRAHYRKRVWQGNRGH